MRKFSVRIFVVAILGLICSSLALSGGYQLNEHGARAVGIGGAFVAQASDPSAIYFNPAGLAFQQGTNIYAGGTFVIPSNTYKTPGGVETSTQSQLFFPPSVYGTYAINDKMVVGLGVFTPYGLGTKWGSDWVGQEFAENSTIETFYVNPTLAYKIADNFSVGIGVSYIYGTVDISRRIATYSPIPVPPYVMPASVDGNLSMSGNGSTWGFNLGVLYKPIDKLSLGASVRSLSRIDFSGTANFTNMQALQSYFPGGTGTATLPMPANVYVGAAYQFDENLTVEADFQYVGWSAYQALTIQLPTGPVSPLTGTPLQATSSSPKNWDDGYLGRIGAEYKLNSDWTLRGGLIYDITPQPNSTTEPMLPDADRVDISVGGGYKISDNLYVDAAYMIVLFSQKDATNSIYLPGTYNSIANVVSINIGYSFAK
ncbi:MAG TPA: outer membrane protein transport protein [Bacteroidota bacterium]|nr:outer membrane protein transport protein [Bacteroidota bacterium]